MKENELVEQLAAAIWGEHWFGWAKEKRQSLMERLLPAILSHVNASVGATVEACAKVAEDDDNSHRSVDIAAAIRSLAPEAAHEELERVKLRAAIEEAKNYTTIVRAMVESPRAHKRCLKECEGHLADLERQLAALSGKEPSHDQAKI